MRFATFTVFVVIAMLISSIILGNAIAETEWKIYKLNIKDQQFKIPYLFTNGELSLIEVDLEFSSWIVNINTSGVEDGTLMIIIPRNLLDPKVGEEDEDFIVLVDGEDSNYREGNKSHCFRTLEIPIPSGTEDVEFIQTWVGYQPNRTSETAVPPIHVTTDKNNYEIGDIITVSGCTNLGLDDKELIIEVLNPEGKIYRTISVTPNIDGSFSTSVVVEAEHVLNGTYTAKASYAGQSATSSFVIPEFPLFATLIFATAISFIVITRLYNVRRN